MKHIAVYIEGGPISVSTAKLGPTFARGPGSKGPAGQHQELSSESTCAAATVKNKQKDAMLMPAPCAANASAHNYGYEDRATPPQTTGYQLLQASSPAAGRSNPYYNNNNNHDGNKQQECRQQ